MQRNNVRVQNHTKHKNGGQSKVSVRASNGHATSRSTQGDSEKVSRPRDEAGALHHEEQGLKQNEELRWRINQLEKEKLGLTSKCNQEVSGYDAQLARCRALLEKGEAQRQTLEYELAVAKRDSAAQKSHSENKTTDLIKRNQQLEGLSAELHQRASDLQKALEHAWRTREEDEQGLQAELRERDHMVYSISTEKEQLQEEKICLQNLLQEQKDILQDMKNKMERLQKDHQRDAEALRGKASELKHSADREKKLRKEVEAAMQRIKSLEESLESERVAHLESKFNAEVLQVRLRDLEAAFSEEKRNHAEAASDLQLLKQKFGEVEKAHTDERERVANTQHTMLQLEKQYASTKIELIEQLEREKTKSADLIGQLEHEKTKSADLIGQLEHEKTKSADLIGQLEREKTKSADLIGQIEHKKTKSADLIEQLERKKTKSADLIGQLEHEKTKAADLIGQLEHEKTKSADLIGQLEREKTKSAKVIGQLEQEKAESAKRLFKLQELERSQCESKQELTLVDQRKMFLEEAHENLLMELKQILEHYNHQGAPLINTTDGDKLSLSALMDILRRSLHNYHTQLKDLLKVVEVLNNEIKEKEKLINEQKRHIQECETRCVRVSDEAECLRASVADATTATDRAHSELLSVTRRWNQMKEQLADAQAQIHTLSQEHDKEQQVKLAFLHTLYQQLLAGSVFVTPAQSLMGSFSWTELSAVLQEHADMLISDLNSANQKISSLERVCDGKAAALKSVCDQLKQREEHWLKQREDLETQHKHLINELHTRVQDLRNRLAQTEESLHVSVHAQSALRQNASRLQDLVHKCRREESSLLAACALLAGCVRAFHGRVRALAFQKAVMCRRACDAESLEQELSSLLHTLSNTSVEERVRGGVWRFRACAIAVMGALRLRTLSRTSHTLFRLAGGVCVSRLVLKEGPGQRKEKEEERSRVMKMLRSSEFGAIVHGCMQGVQKELENAEGSECLRTAARSSFAKLMEKLLPKSESICWGCYGDVGSLSWQLSQGLNRLRKTHHLPPRNDSKFMLSSLQQHFLAYTQRLHSTEVERRDLRIELARLRHINAHKQDQPQDSAHSEPEDDAHTHTTPVFLERFRSVCAELSSALQREQQAQSLLREQALQLHELSLTMDLHAGEQLQKDQTLAQAVQSLSEVKAELKRRDRSLQCLGNQLNQSQQEKLLLQECIAQAEKTLQTAAKAKECLLSYIKSVERSLQEHRDRLVLSRSTPSGENFSLQLPTDTARISGGPEITACKALVCNFTEVYELVCCKMACLEREISSYQSSIAAPKAERHSARLPKNKCNVNGSNDAPALVKQKDVKCSAQKFLPRKKSKAVKKT